jgi:hypothetical protein
VGVLQVAQHSVELTAGGESSEIRLQAIDYSKQFTWLVDERELLHVLTSLAVSGVRNSLKD